MTDDDWPWCTEQQPEEERTFHPGCLLVIGVCVLLWLLVIIGAVNLYPH